MNNRNIKRLIDKAQKAYSIRKWNRVCQAFDCTNPSICSHSQTERFLKKIEEDNKVYALNRDYFKYQKYRIGLTSIKKASIFKGFCSQHDNDIFSSIDSDPQIPIRDGFVDVLTELFSLGGSRQLGNYQAYQGWSFC